MEEAEEQQDWRTCNHTSSRVTHQVVRQDGRCPAPADVVVGPGDGMRGGRNSRSRPGATPAWVRITRRPGKKVGDRLTKGAVSGGRSSPARGGSLGLLSMPLGTNPGRERYRRHRGAVTGVRTARSGVPCPLFCLAVLSAG
jgi:hypothetical protein